MYVARSRWGAAARQRSELRSKDATIAALQDEVQRLQRTTQKANWPRFLPLLYMDIEAEVREPVRKRHVKFTYYYWMCTWPCAAGHWALCWWAEFGRVEQG